MMNSLSSLAHLRRYLVAADLFGLLLLPSMGLLLRTESWSLLVDSWQVVAGYTLLFAAIRLLLFHYSSLYREMWAYASVYELLVAVRALSFAAILEIGLFLLLVMSQSPVVDGLPRSLPVIDALLTTFYIAGVRLGIRVLFWIVNRRDGAPTLKPVLIVGAGVAGIMIARELQTNMQLGLNPIGFVDDDPVKAGRRICNIPVFGPMAEIPRAVRHHGVKEVIIAMPTARGQVVRQVVQLCKESGVASKTTPGLFEILRGSAEVTQMRAVRLEDLLRREVIRTNPEGVRSLLGGARVLITGAGGSIGSEIVRQISEYSPSQIVLLGHGENSMFHIMKEMEDHSQPGMTLMPVVADVRDGERMADVFRQYQPQVVFHAAAHKHVWLMEVNLPDAVTNNVLGTRTLVDLAERYAVGRFVMISSDKAVNPTSVMGVTKRVAELIVQDAANRTGMGFSTVRFGNVLGSRGSVVPLFESQIRRGGPVTITHPDVTRYFMTIPEAVQLVLSAGSMGKGGEVFVLDMGEQLKVIDVARDLIRLSGYTEEEIGIRHTGLKLGEKMYEELFYPGDDMRQTAHDKIWVSHRNHALEFEQFSRHRGIRSASVHTTRIRTEVDALIGAAHRGDLCVIDQILRRIVPQYTPALEYNAESPEKPEPRDQLESVGGKTAASV